MALSLTGTSVQLPLSAHRPSFSLSRHVVRRGVSESRLRLLSFPATARISLRLPSSASLPSIRRLCPNSSSATAATTLSLASAASPLTFRRSQEIRPLLELLEADGAGFNGGSSGGGTVGDNDGDSNMTMVPMLPARDEWPPVDRETEDPDSFFPGPSSSELEKSALLGLLLWFSVLKERLLVADDGFLVKVFMDLGIKNFFKEPEAVFADVAMAIVANFMPGILARFFNGCPKNAFQSTPSPYSLAHSLGALAIRTAVRNALIHATNVAGKPSSGEVEEVLPQAAGVYMAISDNLRCHLLNGVIEQRILEPLLHKNKFMLGAISFAVRTGDTFLGNLLWNHYGRRIGIYFPSQSFFRAGIDALN